MGSWFFGIWIARWLKFFIKISSSVDFVYLQGVNWGHSCAKNALGASLFCKHLNFSMILKTFFFFSPWILTLVQTLVKLDNISGSWDPNPPSQPQKKKKKKEKGYFHECWIGRKKFESLELADHKCYTDQTY